MKIRTIIRELGKLRRFRAARAERVSWRIRLKKYQDWLQSLLPGNWPGVYVELENGDFIYVPKPIERHGQILITQPPRHDPLIDKFCRPGSTAIDIGANIGEMALPMAKATGTGGRMFAFEPIPSLADALDKTFAVNGLAHASSHCLALSDHDGTATLHMNINDREIMDSGISSLEKSSAGSTPIEVKTATLDGFLKDMDIPPISFIKIDVEGHELAVLKGAKKTLEQYKPALLIETGHETEVARIEMHGIFTRLGYRMIGVRYETYLLPAEWHNYLNCEEPFRKGLWINMLLIPQS